MKQLHPMYWMIAALLGLASAGNVFAAPLEECPAWQADYVPISATSPFKDKIEYPEIARTLAKKWAHIFGVPSSWIISQAYVESQNHPLAANPRTGATGLLQIKLIRARDLVKWISQSRWAANPSVQRILSTYWHNLRSSLLAPELNVMLAAFDLHHLRERFGHDHRLVAAAYNQGEGCISRCLATGMPLPPKAVEYVARVERAKRHGYT